MKSTLYNYTRVMQREAKIYSIAGSYSASGISTNYIKIAGFTTVLFALIGYILSLIFNINMFNILEPNFSIYWAVYWIGFGFILGTGLYKIQIGGYRLYEYLRAYFKPKKVYTNSFERSEKIYTQANIKVDAIVSQIL